MATVDASGLVTGVSDGTAVITASQDGADGTASLVVVRPSLLLDEDAVLGGDVMVENLTIMPGVTVTLSADLRIDARGAVTIEGSVMGDCMAVKMEAEGSVTISGELNNACVSQAIAGEDAPAIEISAPGGVNLDDATIVSSGPVIVVSEPSPPAPTQSPGASRAPWEIPGVISLPGANIRGEPTEAAQAPAVGRTSSGSVLFFRAKREVILNGTTLRAQHGGLGYHESLTSENRIRGLVGGDGGFGGSIFLSVEEGGMIILRTDRGESEVTAGDGGRGGSATATTTRNPFVDPAPDAFAGGGNGGEGGGVFFVGRATHDGGVGLFRVHIGNGGSGGNGTATAANGVDADGSRSAQVGGEAEAKGGAGARIGTLDGGFEGITQPDDAEGGAGGFALAISGNGGNGIRGAPDGASGGKATAGGGTGGDAYLRPGNIGGNALATGGSGGDGAEVFPASTDRSLSGQISVVTDPASSDPFIFDAGTGIALGLIYRILNARGGPGGEGGDGADLGARGGAGGIQFGGENLPGGAAGVASVGAGGNGGMGVTGGDGGSAGSFGAGSDLDAGQSNPVFEDGFAGGDCQSSSASRTSASNPGLLLNQADQTIEINGSGAWVNVTGALADDGTVTATGRGTVAGVPDILVEFSGTWDEETQTLQGTYTVDSEKIISAGHPVVYDVIVSGG